jgi:hypothetical protein
MLALLLARPLQAIAQEAAPTGSIGGRVVDELGGPIAGAQVFLIRPAIATATRTDGGSRQRGEGGQRHGGSPWDQPPERGTPPPGRHATPRPSAGLLARVDTVATSTAPSPRGHIRP